ncbi:unnamed protein product [Trifolium pratense]|uniref:Uncharacterized protein n=1 Tax=Trifolium pratense TaxID=57577 RepID=A0ACB0JJX9_TRIPR|nr:unnamed protein product [Trifolium pratense]
MDWIQTTITYPCLDENEIDALAAPITNDEVKNALFEMSPWKAPGPDGFPAGFYQKSWNIVGDTMCNFVRRVWDFPSEIGMVNKTDICLIPKVPHPEVVTQFRPISLCNTNYKIVSKVLVERLKTCIPLLISPYQTGFVPGRNIHENIVVAKEMIHTMNRMRGNKGVFAIKVDLSKAYDKLSWNFIWRVLNEIKLPDKMLSHLIMHSVDVGEWRGIKAGRSGPMVSHLMFADDLLLFGEASEKQMRCVMNILNKFCLMSGQEVSQEKTSILFSKNVNSGMRDKLLHLSGFREAYDLDKYLGVPLIGRAPKKADYQYLIDQVSNKLVKWKARQLSFAGRVTLAKSVLEAVPTYPMMTSRIPQSYLDEIQKIQRNFIWGDTENVRRYHAVRWSVVTMPKDMGGLGLRRLDAMNKACLLKLGWKLNNGSTDFWCEVLRGKYGSNSLTIEMNTRSSDSNLWKSLINLRLFLLNNTFWNIGEGFKDGSGTAKSNTTP